MSKLDELQKLRNQVNLTINNLDEYPKGETNVLVANHNCLMDIFYLPMSLPEEIVSLVSARLVYKNENDRKEVINRYLHALPVEAHGGSRYVNICLNQAVRILKSGISLSIFPEGAYVYDNKIFRGRTGASRMIYSTRESGKQVNLVPVSIHVSRNDDLDSYTKVGDSVEISFLPPINYEEAYYNFLHSQTKEEMNKFLHQPIDEAMQLIADALEIPYDGSYIELRPKGNVMFSNGTVVDTLTAQNTEYIDKYNEELKVKTLKLLRQVRN